MNLRFPRGPLAPSPGPSASPPARLLLRALPERTNRHSLQLALLGGQSGPSAQTPRPQERGGLAHAPHEEPRVPGAGPFEAGPPASPSGADADTTPEKTVAASLRVRTGDPEGTLRGLGRARTLGLCAHAAGGQARATHRPSLRRRLLIPEQPLKGLLSARGRVGAYHPLLQRPWAPWATGRGRGERE